MGTVTWRLRLAGLYRFGSDPRLTSRLIVPRALRG